MSSTPQEGVRKLNVCDETLGLNIYGHPEVQPTTDLTRVKIKSSHPRPHPKATPACDFSLFYKQPLPTSQPTFQSFIIPPRPQLSGRLILFP